MSVLERSSTVAGEGGRLDAAEHTARQASLAYVSDAEPGIRRKRSGKGSSFFGADGKRIKDRATLARIRALAIPPAWTYVWICSDPDGHMQATGRDQRGRKQYRYHQRWSASRDEVKYSNLADFARALPLIRERIDKDLRRRELPRERVLASVVWLLDNTMIRVGNAAYARDNKSFGLTTLHVVVEGARLRFAFKGKSGKEWKLKLVDRRIARVVRGAQDIPGQKLFQYLDENGIRRPVRSQDINGYIREAAGNGFSAKHFRTWGGTIHAAALFAQTECPESKSAQRRVMNGIIDKVAERLVNTRSVCRKSYIHPTVLNDWLDGKLNEGNWSAAKVKRMHPGFNDDEARLLNWLRKHRS